MNVELIATIALVSAVILGYTMIFIDYRNDRRSICYADGSLRPIYARLTPYQRFLAVTVSTLGRKLELIYAQQMQTWYRGIVFIPEIDPVLSDTQLETLRLLAATEIKLGDGFVWHWLTHLRPRSRSTVTHATFE